MNPVHRRRFILIAVVLVAGLTLLGRWAMRPDEPVREPPRMEEAAAVDNQPAASEPSAGDAVAPSPALSALGTFRGRVVDAVTSEPVRVHLDTMSR